MGYEANYDSSNDVVCLEIKDVYSVDDANAFNREAEEMLKGRDIRQIMVDLSEAQKLADTETRRLTSDGLRKLSVSDMAMFNARPVARIMGKILSRLSGDQVETGFFATREKALEWLKKRRKK
jgi:hypothetical protein